MDAPEDAFFVTTIGRIYRLVVSYRVMADGLYNRYIEIHHDSTCEHEELSKIKAAGLLGSIRELVTVGVDLARSLEALNEHVNEGRIEDSKQIKQLRDTVDIHKQVSAKLRDMMKSMSHLVDFRG